MDLPPICIGCKNFDNTRDFSQIRCKAFTGRIPQEILQNKVDHRKSYRGDHGIIFEPVDPDSEIYAQKVFDNVEN